MDINFEYYKVFYHVAKYKNITKAAAALGSNQPNVSRIIKLLETQLNCRLIIRESRGIHLTEEGERLYLHVEIAYRHLLDAQEEIGGQALPGSGTVKIGATETVLHLFLLEVLHDFKIQYPEVKVKIHNSTTLETLKQLHSGKLDFVLVTTPFEVPGTACCEKMMDFKEILVGGTQYQHLCKTPVKLKEMKRYPWVGLGRGTATYELYRNFFIGHKTDLDLDVEVATSDLLLPLIKNNLGIGFVPEPLAFPFLQKQEIVQIPVSCEVPGRSIRLVCDKGRTRNSAADIFYKYLKSRKK